MSDNNIRARVDALNSMIGEGRIMEAMNEFYADDVIMSENDNEPTVGLEANLSREQDFVDNTRWYGAELKDVVVGGDVAMTRWWLDFHNANYGQRLAFHQVAYQRWRDGRIVEERFYYSPTPVES